MYQQLRAVMREPCRNGYTSGNPSYYKVFIVFGRALSSTTWGRVALQERFTRGDFCKATRLKYPVL